MENRVVIHAPTGKDAKLIAQVLERTGVESHVCVRAADVSGELKKGVGAFVLVNEALSAPLLRQLTQFLAEQPAWSDLPVLVMSQRGFDSPDIRQYYLQLGNVTLLERPLQSVTLASAATSALRVRRRQYAMREVDRQKDEFLAMLAHELRNPLAPVSAASDLLKLPNLDRDKIKQTSDIISRQVRHMTGLIDDLLDVSRVSRGLVTLDVAVLDARQIVTSAVEQVRPLIDARRHRLSLRIPPELTSIQGDQKRLVQILSNLLNNAAKYTPEGGDIALCLDVDDDQLVFTVTDNGIGITDDVIDHIFEMFAQAARTSDRTQGGLGIGLALVKNLVQLHGGTVSAHSEGAGKGSRFQLTFPRSVPCQAAFPAPNDAVAQRATDVRLLLVDDNVDAAMMLGLLLETAGYQVQVVHTASAALETAADAQRVDACLLDIGLPDMDGNDLAKQLRAIPATSAAILIAITGYGQEIDRCKTRDAGFDHHHVKPVDVKKLFGTLATLH